MSNEMNRINILDCMPGIGVLVLARDSYETLYSNDKFRRIKQRLWPQVTAQEIFSGSGGRRLREGAAQPDGYAAVFHDIDSGEDLDVTFHETVWTDGTDTYTLTITEHKARSKEDGIVWDRQLLGAVMRVYPRVMSVNLSSDSYSIMDYQSRLTQHGKQGGRYSDLHIQGLASTHPDYREAFAEKFSRENLLARFASGEKEEYLEALQIGPDRRYHWSSTHSICINNPYNDDVMAFILIRSLDDQRELEKEINMIRAEANRYRNAITMTFDHIYEVDAANDRVYEIRISNGRAQREELGSIQEVNRVLILERMHPSHLETYGDDRPWMNLLPENGNVNLVSVYEDDWYLRQSNGEYRWERIQIVPGEDNPNEIMIYAKDVHDLKLREEKQRELLFEALANAENANSAKRDFLSRMSHDMRTPMNAIVGLTTIAQAKLGDDEKVADALEKIRSSSQHLLRLINEVLDMSRIESGKITLEEEEFNISELLESVMASIRTQSKHKNQTMVVHTQEMSHAWLLGDRFRLEQVLLNILSNAVKYTGRDGFIMLSLCDTPSTHENITNVTICVEDNGVGMSEEFVGKLFEPFERELQPETQNEQGTGLGLPIVKNIVDRMNGTIRVDSKLGIGTCFAVNIPMRIPKSAINEEQMPVQCETQSEGEIGAEKCSGRRFLLVDDNELNREIGQEILQMLGARVDLACDGQQAIDVLIHSPAGQYDAVFMDVQMPVKNGYDATRELRACTRQDLNELPIFAMTANAFADDVQDALDAGMNAHLAKPLDMSALFRVLDRYL